MALQDDVDWAGQLIDGYAGRAFRMGVAQADLDDAGVPLQMQVGAVDPDGWVEWRVLPSTLAEGDIIRLETEYRIMLPPAFRAYLLARFHLFDQLRSRRYDQQILMTDTPAQHPLKPLHEIIAAWRPLLEASYLPFAQWGDGWGPICFDTAQRRPDGEYAVIWLDHEPLISVGPDGCRRREAISGLAQPLYASSKEFLEDVFSSLDT